ncbi:hypothetical protein SBA5_590075 [Candidatus Sulfotelmatomonas gaucii]|uniref:Uncharacterized protein n=1 Tax=Candidatus Sulfuritelmatomonas gaucii TaxID=2043161 RepID=A0A2N9LW00_9BACT|nr:hypothetical protein SBA5_590075 [Candidatus Sulfotelmatomonas gaucii]
MDWLNALNVWPSIRSLTPSRIGKVYVMYMSEYVKWGPRTELRRELRIALACLVGGVA